LFPALCSLSDVSVRCLPSSVPCLTSLFLVSHPLFHVSLLCSLSPVLCSQSYVSFFASRSLSPILNLCSLYPILLSRQFVVLHCFRICSACDEIISEYAQCAMKSFQRMLSMSLDVHIKLLKFHCKQENSFGVCSVCALGCSDFDFFSHFEV
jgi:hypothetical protein